ncbi:Hypothetical_protein [Hexamita inflata]|uniref:Hypothetical_protein n=1 Tax=Hexamita inflata TaxID=28002 RepID=A0AA86VSJ6_9EUKA|nr:Hypothetical protein HINF_LOCUS63753 [Hexamita inflata]
MSWVQNSQQTSEHQSKSVLSDGTSGDRLGYPLCTREREQMSPRVVRLAFTNRLAHQKPSIRRPQSTRRQRQAARAWRRHSGRPGMQEQLLVQVILPVQHHLIPNCEVKSGQEQPQVPRWGDYAGTGCAERFLSHGACFFPSRQRVPECAGSFPQRSRQPGFVGPNRTKYSTAVAESA